MQKIWKIFPGLTKVVRQAHLDYDMQRTGHDFDHALRGAQNALLIAEDDGIGRLAGAAGLCHNADRMLQHRRGVGKKDVPGEDAANLIRHWLDESAELASSEGDRVVQAVLLHSGPNREDGDDVLVALQDADRLTCAMAQDIMETAKFWAELPTVNVLHLADDPNNPYRSPGSVMNSLRCRRDWITPGSPFCVRLPRAMAIMEGHIRVLEEYIRNVIRQRAEIGLWPDYPS